jgi:hypothetical protein
MNFIAEDDNITMRNWYFKNKIKNSENLVKISHWFMLVVAHTQD